MADPPDLDALARRYLQFWEEQAAAISADPAMADLVARLFGAFAPGGWTAGFASGADNGFGPASSDHEPSETSNGHRQGQPDGKRQSKSGRQGGAAAAGAPSVADDDWLDELLRRVAALEERIAALEAGRDAAGSGTRRQPKKG